LVVAHDPGELDAAVAVEHKDNFAPVALHEEIFEVVFHPVLVAGGVKAASNHAEHILHGLVRNERVLTLRIDLSLRDEFLGANKSELV
jgi:hypothetical protein